MSTDTNSTVLGVVVIIRHGDREGFYQDPSTYDASETTITAVGSVQEVQLGTLLRSIYLNDSSSSRIQSMSSTALFNASQFVIRADAGDEGEVIVDSANALTQGLFPNSSFYNTTLANGTTVVGPLNGYQYVPIDTLDSSTNIEFQGFTSCSTFTTYVNDFYNSTEFKAKANESAAFLSDLAPYLDGRPVNLQNMWNIFDFMNVNSIHNATFLNSLPPTYLAQTRALANWHQYNSFSDPSINGIGNVAGRTMIPSTLSYMQRMGNSSDGLAFAVQAMSYKPFLSLFNMTGAAEVNSSLAAIVDYAAALALEVRQGSSGQKVVRFNFKNGTSQDDFVTYNMFGAEGDIPLSTFVDNLAPTGVNTTAEWCSVCSNSVDRGCGSLALASQAALATVHHNKISPVGAGFLGAGLTLAVVAICFGVLAFLGILTIGRRSRRATKQGSEDGKF